MTAQHIMEWLLFDVYMFYDNTNTNLDVDVCRICEFTTSRNYRFKWNYTIAHNPD